MPGNENDRNYINFWPFDGYKDGVRRHWEWLRRWLLANQRTRVTVIGLLTAGLLVALAAGVWHMILENLVNKPLQPANSVLVKNTTVSKTKSVTNNVAHNTPDNAAHNTANNAAHNTADNTAHNTADNTAHSAADNTAYNASNDAVASIANASKNKTAETTGSAAYSGPDFRESLNLALPLQGQVTTHYGMGYSTLYEDFRFHEGIDVLSTKDDVVKAVMAGQVEKVSQSPNEGLTITIKHANGYVTSYGDITSPEVTVGQQVDKGQAIAKVEAETGILHFAIQKGQQGLNPLQYLSY